MAEKGHPTSPRQGSSKARWDGRQPCALVVCDDPFTELGRLTADRCKAALPFAGKYRLIDFSLSNCVNSDIETVGVITQYNPRSLQSHVAYGRPWDLDRPTGGLSFLQPYQGRKTMNWYSGSADAVHQNQDYILRQKTDEVLILFGSQVYTMDFGPMIAQHRETQAHLTLAVVPVDQGEDSHVHTLRLGSQGTIREVVVPGTQNGGTAAPMGVLLFSTQALNWRLNEDAQRVDSAHDLLCDLIPHIIRSGDRVLAYQHTGYWNSLKTVQDYWQAGMDLLGEHPQLNLQDASWPIRTHHEIRPPSRVSIGARMTHSLISEGCIIDGTVEYSVLSPGVSIAPGAVVRNSILMHNASIEERALVENTILDMDVIVGPQAHVGESCRRAPTLYETSPSGLTIVEKGTRIPAQERIGPEPEASEWLIRQQQDLRSRRVDAT